MGEYPNKATSVLTAAGWRDIGDLPKRESRIFTGRSSVPNATITTGGRHRLELPGTQRRVTDGPRTLCFFVYDGGVRSGFESSRSPRRAG